jgi:hypothetical protein
MRARKLSLIAALRTKIAITLGVVWVLWSVACSSASSTACDIAGLYVVNGTTQSGNCPTPDSNVTDTFSVSGNTATLVFAGLVGPGCTGPVSGCTWTASCDITDTTATSPSDATITAQYSYTFTETGFTGTLGEDIPPSTGLTSGCRGVMSATGTKQ